MATLPDSRKAAYRFILLLGVVSLLADVTYEGARSITGPWMAILGASAAAVGVVSGLGELLGYALRIICRGSDGSGHRSPVTVDVSRIRVVVIKIPSRDDFRSQIGMG